MAAGANGGFVGGADRLRVQTVASSVVELAALLEMAVPQVPAVLGQARIALHAVLAAEVVGETVLCLMLALARESTSRKQPTSMLATEEISMSCGREETSPASSRAAAC